MLESTANGTEAAESANPNENTLLLPCETRFFIELNLMTKLYKLWHKKLVHIHAPKPFLSLSRQIRKLTMRKTWVSEATLYNNIIAVTPGKDDVSLWHKMATYCIQVKCSNSSHSDGSNMG